ncbi:MAG TPA: ABC transporter permease [Verrucomicrobiae bacterium]|nr:ABC transporter permease [Verrucomicrobiae bacterium]
MSKLPFELLLALRYLRPKRTFVSIITLISILGVALGVAVLIIVISVMSGFDHDLRGKILGYKSHLTISQWNPEEQMTLPMTNYAAVAETIAKNKNVRGVAPFVMGPVLVETQGETNRAGLQDTPVLRGVDAANEGKVSDLPRKVIFGDFDLTGHGMVVGSDFARNMNLRLGDHLAVYSAHEIKKMLDAYNHNEHVVSSPADFEVRGIFSMGYYEFDAHVIVTSIENAQELYDLQDDVHGALVMLNDPYQAPQVKTELEKSLGDNYNVATWMEQSSDLLSAIEVEKNVMFYLLFFIVLVAALCILSAQITFVIQKTREIGMLKALGATKLQISGIFLFQSAIIGIIGVTSGFGLGMLAVIYRNGFLHFLRSATGLEIFPASIYGFNDLPALIMPNDVAIICISSFVICVLGGLLPAWRAGRLKPVEALRYE